MSLRKQHWASKQVFPCCFMDDVDDLILVIGSDVQKQDNAVKKNVARLHGHDGIRKRRRHGVKC